MIRTRQSRFISALLFFSFVLLLSGCTEGEDTDGVDAKPSSLESIRVLEEEVFEVYSLAPCSQSHEYCSFPFLIEEVDALIAAYCRENQHEEALRVFSFFEHFEDPSPQPPEC